MVFRNKSETEQVLEALAAQMDELNLPPLGLVVCGGSALNILGFLERTTKDIDVVAFIEKDSQGHTKIDKGSIALKKISPAVSKVGRDFNLPDGWINSGPESALDLGMPDGFLGRVEVKKYSEKLTIHFLGRFDQICFKFYAAADQGQGKHYDDLQKLKPTKEELVKAAKWSMTHDISEGYRQSVIGLLTALGHKDVAERI